jgi:hypothetical protein
MMIGNIGGWAGIPRSYHYSYEPYLVHEYVRGGVGGTCGHVLGGHGVDPVHKHQDLQGTGDNQNITLFLLGVAAAEPPAIESDVAG